MKNLVSAVFPGGAYHGIITETLFVIDAELVEHSTPSDSDHTQLTGCKESERNED